MAHLLKENSSVVTVSESEGRLGDPRCRPSDVPRASHDNAPDRPRPAHPAAGWLTWAVRMRGQRCSDGRDTCWLGVGVNSLSLTETQPQNRIIGMCGTTQSPADLDQARLLISTACLAGRLGRVLARSAFLRRALAEKKERFDPMNSNEEQSAIGVASWGWLASGKPRRRSAFATAVP